MGKETVKDSYVKPNHTTWKQNIMDLSNSNPFLNCGDHEHLYPGSSNGKPIVKEMDFFAADKNSSKGSTHTVNQKKVCADDGLVHALELHVSLC